jgi:hypothetical protein
MIATVVVRDFGNAIEHFRDALEVRPRMRLGYCHCRKRETPAETLGVVQGTEPAKQPRVVTIQDPLKNMPLVA